MNKDQIKEEPC